MSLLFSGPSSITPWLEEAAFLAIQGKPYPQRPRLVQVLRRSTLNGSDVLFVHDGKTSVATLVTLRHDESEASVEPPRPPLQSSISRGCIVRISDWVVSSFPNDFQVHNNLNGASQTRTTAMICLEAQTVELLGGNGMGIVGDAIDVNDSVDVRRALLSIHHNVQVLRENLRRGQGTSSAAKVAANTEIVRNGVPSTVTTRRTVHSLGDSRARLNRDNVDLWDNLLQQAQRDREKEDTSGSHCRRDKGDDVPPLQQNNVWDPVLDQAQRDRMRQSPTRRRRQVGVANDLDPLRNIGRPVVLGDVTTLLPGARAAADENINRSHQIHLGDVQGLFREEAMGTRSSLDDLLNLSVKHPGTLTDQHPKQQQHTSRLGGDGNHGTQVENGMHYPPNAKPALGDVMALLNGKLRVSVDDVLMAASAQRNSNEQFSSVSANPSDMSEGNVTVRHASNRSRALGDIILGNVAALVLNKADDNSRGVARFSLTGSAENAYGGNPADIELTPTVPIGDVTALLEGRGPKTFEDVLMKAYRQEGGAKPASNDHIGVGSRQINSRDVTTTFNQGTSPARDSRSGGGGDQQIIPPGGGDDKYEGSSESDEHSEVAGISTMLESQDDDESDNENSTSEHLKHAETQPGLEKRVRLSQPIPGESFQANVNDSSDPQDSIANGVLPDHQSTSQLATKIDEFSTRSILRDRDPTQAGGTMEGKKSPQSQCGTTRQAQDASSPSGPDQNEGFSQADGSSLELTQDRIATQDGGDLRHSRNDEAPLRPRPQELKSTAPSKRPRQPVAKPCITSKSPTDGGSLNSADFRGDRAFHHHLLRHQNSDTPLSVKTQVALKASLGLKLPCLLIHQRQAEDLRKVSHGNADESQRPKHKKHKLDQPSTLLDRLIGQINEGNIFSFKR